MCALSGSLAALNEQTDLVKGVPLDNRFVGSVPDDPFFRRQFEAFLGFVIYLTHTPLYHLPDINLVL
jgi:hypothetical protein